ncbi:hypothetical protein [Rubritalea marina]|uniref:hypothetical protein n=1 Tax=Rubritalea marina TaxID=361055 RepID=UPI0003A5D126|nr:hypothetical protein [Rubritalea marina]
MTKSHMLQQSQELSFISQAFIALRITENYFAKIGFTHPIIDEFFYHLWELPQLQSPQEFSQWEARRGDLVDFGLTDDLPDDLEGVLALTPLDEEQLFKIIEAPVEILWGNFFSTPNQANTRELFENALNLAEKEGVIFPKLDPFLLSKWADNNAWGKALSMDELTLWKNA